MHTPTPTRRRLEKRIYIPLPCLEGRRQLLDINTRGLQLGPNADLDALAAQTDGYSGTVLSITHMGHTWDTHIAHTHTHMHAHTHIYTHVHIHTCTHTHIHTCTHIALTLSP